MDETTQRHTEELMGIIRDIRLRTAICLTPALRRADLTLSEYVLMDLLRDSVTMKMSEIARKLSVTTSAVTSMVDTMVRARLLRRKRDEQDRRVVQVSLTQQGVGLTDELHRQAFSAFGSIMSDLGTAEQVRWMRVFRKMHSLMLEDGRFAIEVASTPRRTK